MSYRHVLEHFPTKKSSGSGFVAKCPAHEDRVASLSISQGDDGRALLHCHAGCSVEAITQALGLTLDDLFEPRERPEPIPYDYRDEAGTLIYQAVRFPSANGTKEFRQRQPDGNGGWTWKLAGVRRLVYRLPQLKGHPSVYIVEGEKDADRLWSLGLPATTNSGGAGKWSDDLTKQLVAAGIKRVAVLADNDPPGDLHARTVARSCHDAGLGAKVILLPGLPPKGDVSDWLNAGHTKTDLNQIAKDAPFFQAHAHLSSQPLKLELTSLADLLAEPEDAFDWLVEERIPAGSVILLSGQPKAGKSVLARNLAYSVAVGARWLGYKTTAGPVWYLGMEDKRSEVRRHFRGMGATGREPIWMLTGAPPENVMTLLRDRAMTEKPLLIIVDTLQRLINAKDMSDYAEITTKFNPLLALSRETGACLVVVHHSNKYGEGLNRVLGSTALTASADNILLLDRSADDIRSLSSIQRIGNDLEATVVEMDEDTGQVRLSMPKKDADLVAAEKEILDVLATFSEPQTKSAIGEFLDRRWQVVARALYRLVGSGQVTRTGGGKRGDAHRYALAKGGSGLREDSRDDTDLPLGTSGTRKLLHFAAPNAPFDPGAAFLVPEVPEVTQNRAISGGEIAASASGHSTYSMSRGSDFGGDDE